MKFLPKTFRSSRATDAETVSLSPSNTTTSNIWFNKSIRSDVQEKNKHFGAIFHGFESSSGITLTSRTIPEQIADKGEATVDVHVLDPSSHSGTSNGRSDINAITPVTSQAEKLKLKHETFKQNAKKKSDVHESQLLISENEGALNIVVLGSHRRELSRCGKSKKPIMV